MRNSFLKVREICSQPMKLLFTLFNFLFFFFVGTTDPQVVAIVHNLPTELKIGERVLISLEIDKSNLSGFGLIELKFPDNCIVGAGELDNASFTFENNKARIVWMKMPDVKTLHVSYYLTFTGSTATAIDIHGSFSHIEENYRVDEEIPSHPIISNETETIWPVNSLELAVINNIEEAKPEEIPHLSFTPQETVITDHNDAINQKEFQATVEEVATTTTKSMVIVETTVVQADQNEVKVLDQPVIPDRQDTPADYSNLSIYFKVQLLASHKTVNKSFLATTYNFKNEFNIEHHNGWLKYVTGMFETPEAARAHRDELNKTCHDLPGPFITAYKNGERITVQEALMLQSTAYRY